MINVVFKMNYWDFKFNHLTANEAAKTKNEGMYVCVCVCDLRGMYSTISQNGWSYRFSRKLISARFRIQNVDKVIFK